MNSSYKLRAHASTHKHKCAMVVLNQYAPVHEGLLSWARGFWETEILEQSRSSIEEGRRVIAIAR